MALDVLITQYVVRNEPAMLKSFLNGAAAAGKFETANDRAVRSSASWAAAGGVGLAVLGKFTSESIKAAAGVQSTKVAFNTLLGDAGKANSLYADVQKFSLLSPFNNADTAKAAVGLLATGRAADKIIPDLHAVGNAVASVGGDDAKFQGVLAIINKLRLRSKASSVQLNQLALRGINPFKILQDELGLTADQVANIGKQGIKGSEVADALLRGFEKIGDGKAMENLNKTFGGQVSQFEDAKDQLLAASGEIILPDATAALTQLNKFVVGLKDFTKAHQTASKVALYGGGLLSAAAVGGGAIKTLKLAKLARQALEKAVKSDTAAEKIKTGVAGAEGDAINYSATAAARAAGEKAELEMATEGATSAAASEAKQLSLLGKAQGLLKGGTLGELGAGGLAVAGALGVGAGVQANGNMQALGYSQGQSEAYGAVTGIGAAAAAAWLPGGAVAVAVGEGLGFLVNKLYNEPAEAAAEAGSVDPAAAALFEKLRAKSQAKQTASAQTAAFLGDPTDYHAGQDSGLISNGPATATRRRDGALIIPPGPGDRLARQANFNRMTPRTA